MGGDDWDSCCGVESGDGGVTGCGGVFVCAGEGEEGWWWQVGRGSDEWVGVNDWYSVEVVVIVCVYLYVLVVVGVDDGIDICCGSGDDSGHINYNHIKHCKGMTHCAPLFLS